MRGGPTEVNPKKLQEVQDDGGGGEEPPPWKASLGLGKRREMQVFWERETESGITLKTVGCFQPFAIG